MNTISIGSIVAASALSWLLGRLHLRKTQLKALDKSLHLPAGSLEDKANAAAAAAAVLAAQKAGDIIDKRVGL